MKKYLPFFVIFLLVSTIPAIVFALFPDAASNINSGDIPSFDAATEASGSKTEIEKQTSHYLIRLRPIDPPLQPGKEFFELEVLNRGTGSHWMGLPKIQLTDSTGKRLKGDALLAEPYCNQGYFKIEARFTQGGRWDMALVMKDPEELISLSLDIQPK